MALVITHTNVGTGDGSAKIIKYAGLSEADSSPAPVSMLEWADRSVQVVGTFGGGTITIEGSNDGSNWATLTDPQGNNLAITSAKIEQISEMTLYVRPKPSVGTGMNIDVIFALRRANSMRN